jgi:hypothetical protein
MLYITAIIYSTFLTGLITVINLVNIRQPLHLIFTLLFLPLNLYFIRRLHVVLIKPFLEARQTALALQASTPPSSIANAPITETGEVVSTKDVHDINRRLFLKLVGSAGLTTLVFALFKRDAQAAFFGSVPGPGTVALKNTAGEKIDPAEKGPTDGYEISQVDDLNPPFYYGFVNKEGAWYIARESANGNFRYIKGNDDFATSWSTRTSLLYDYFNNVF